jgi:hypothetical protein
MAEQALKIAFSRRVAPETIGRIIREFKVRSSQEGIRVRTIEGSLDEGAVTFFLNASSPLTHTPFSLMGQWLRESTRLVEPDLVIPKEDNFGFWIRPAVSHIHF